MVATRSSSTITRAIIEIGGQRSLQGLRKLLPWSWRLWIAWLRHWPIRSCMARAHLVTDARTAKAGENHLGLGLLGRTGRNLGSFPLSPPWQARAWMAVIDSENALSEVCTIALEAAKLRVFNLEEATTFANGSSWPLNPRTPRCGGP